MVMTWSPSSTPTVCASGRTRQLLAEIDTDPTCIFWG
jgi:hypothetical protein